jgi:hypothetical protein
MSLLRRLLHRSHRPWGQSATRSWSQAATPAPGECRARSGDGRLFLAPCDERLAPRASIVCAVPGISEAISDAISEAVGRIVPQCTCGLAEAAGGGAAGTAGRMKG